MARPTLKISMTAEEFDSFYWYKDELIKFSQLLNLSSSGGKFEIHDRISTYLRGDENQDIKNHKPKSDFDWTHGVLSRDTLITDNYRNTKNVRQFLESELGEKVIFSITVMDWMKQNIGKTLGDFIHHYPAIKTQRRNQEIPDHNQFNRYVRDFLKNNPELSKEDAVETWKRVIEIPRPGSKGRGILYSSQDLKLR